MRLYDMRESGRVPVTLSVAHDVEGRESSTQTKNLSFGGLQLWMGPSSLKRGDRLVLGLWLPAARQRVLCEAEVVYGAGRVAGLKFTRLPLPHRLLLEDYVSTHLMEYWFR